VATAKRLTYEGAVHYLFIGSFDGEAAFRDDRDRQRYLNSLGKFLDLTGCLLYCYVLMDSHVHLVLKTPQGNLTELMRRLQTSYAMYFNRRHEHRGNVFHGRYRSTLVEQNGHLLKLSCSVHLVPIHAGVAARPEDWRWTSYRQYLNPSTATLVHPAPILSYCQGSPEIYRTFVEAGLGKSGEEISRIRKQAFLGSPQFVRVMKQRFSPEAGGATEEDLERLTSKLACQFGLADLDNVRRGRTRLAQQVRQYAMYLARLRWNMRLRVIGQVCGGFNHATVSHGVKVAEKRLQRNPELANSLERLAASIWPGEEDDSDRTDPGPPA